MSLVVAPPIKPMLAKVSEQIPRGDGWIYEPKWDGFRTLVFRDGAQLWLRSRNDRPMNRYFPEVDEMLQAGLPERCVVDGEIILPTERGLDFDALQLRLHPAASRVQLLAGQTPASFVAFDLLAEGSTDLRGLPLQARQEKLDEVLDAATPSTPTEPATRVGPCLYLTPRTTDPDEAQRWFEELERLGLDGIIAKRIDLPYVAGERVMVKVKHRRTADCVVVGYRVHKHGGVGSLLLGLYDDRELRYIGHTSSFNAAGRRALLELLEPLRNESPFEGEWGPGGPSRWSQGRESEWHSIEPVLVCEVSYDYMQAGHRFRHAATFMRWRDDKRPEDCAFDQVRD
jgi:ATP-dependent DNA ligase